MSGNKGEKFLIRNCLEQQGRTPSYTRGNFTFKRTKRPLGRSCILLREESGRIDHFNQRAVIRCWKLLTLSFLQVIQVGKTGNWFVSCKNSSISLWWTSFVCLGLVLFVCIVINFSTFIKSINKFSNMNMKWSWSPHQTMTRLGKRIEGWWT